MSAKPVEFQDRRLVEKARLDFGGTTLMYSEVLGTVSDSWEIGDGEQLVVVQKLHEPYGRSRIQYLVDADQIEHLFYNDKGELVIWQFDLVGWIDLMPESKLSEMPKFVEVVDQMVEAGITMRMNFDVGDGTFTVDVESDNPEVQNQEAPIVSFGDGQLLRYNIQIQGQTATMMIGVNGEQGVVTMSMKGADDAGMFWGIERRLLSGMTLFDVRNKSLNPEVARNILRLV